MAKACFFVCSLIWELYSSMSSKYTPAISDLKGSSGFGSVKRLQRDIINFDIVKDGDQFPAIVSRHILPSSAILGWRILVKNLTSGGLNGNSFGKFNYNIKCPPS